MGLGPGGDELAVMAVVVVTGGIHNNINPLFDVASLEA